MISYGSEELINGKLALAAEHTHIHKIKAALRNWLASQHLFSLVIDMQPKEPVHKLRLHNQQVRHKLHEVKRIKLGHKQLLRMLRQLIRNHNYCHSSTWHILHKQAVHSHRNLQPFLELQHTSLASKLQPFLEPP